MAVVRREAGPGAQLAIAGRAATATVTELPFSA
jgi:hypothetical protein